jgi:hypothetical protein
MLNLTEQKDENIAISNQGNEQSLLDTDQENNKIIKEQEPVMETNKEKTSKLDKESIKEMIKVYENHLAKAAEEGIENLLEVFKVQIKFLRNELEKRESDS